jgi:L-seryl-tRNA(Ser) seleniumtransferase
MPMRVSSLASSDSTARFSDGDVCKPAPRYTPAEKPAFAEYRAIEEGVQKKTDRREAGAELRRLPAVARLLASPPLSRLAPRFGQALLTSLVREEVDRLRQGVLEGTLSGPALETAAAPARVAAAVVAAGEALLAPRPRRVINATGIVVHTNLGRAPLSAEAAADLAAAAAGYVDLEYDLERGARGRRGEHLAPLMARLFPGRGFVAVNNNAGALLLCLRALCRRREAIVSRGELVEIGGSFRVPDIMAASGARLVEIGTTNRTRKSDYERAVGPRTGLILKVHASNFRIVGFTEETPIEELAGIARAAGVPLVVDQGSGDLLDLTPLGIADELPAGRALAAGADLVTFSGDKLFGGPQAGFVVGDPQLIARLARDPLARVLRLDRLILGALSRTLAAYVRGRGFEEIPVLRMIALEPAAIERRARRLARTLRALDVVPRPVLEIVDGVSRTGGGSSPAGERPTRLLAIELPDLDAAPLERALRRGELPVIARVQDGRLLLDLRTVAPGEDEPLAEMLATALYRVTAAERPKPRRRA